MFSSVWLNEYVMHSVKLRPRF